MNNPFCKHNVHQSIRCFQCERERIAGAILRPIQKQLTESEKREAAKKRIYEAAKRLDW